MRNELKKKKDATKRKLRARVQQLVSSTVICSLRSRCQRISRAKNGYEASCCWAQHQRQNSFHRLTQQLNRTEGKTPSDAAASTEPDLLQSTNESEMEAFDSVTTINERQSMKIILKLLLQLKRCLFVSRKAMNCCLS